MIGTSAMRELKRIFFVLDCWFGRLSIPNLDCCSKQWFRLWEKDSISTYNTFENKTQYWNGSILSRWKILSTRSSDSTNQVFSISAFFTSLNLLSSRINPELYYRKKSSSNNHIWSEFEIWANFLFNICSL